MYLPQGADNGTASESNVRERYTASGDAAEGEGFAAIRGIGDQGWRDPGDGLSFGAFGLSMCHDTAAMVTTTIGDAAWTFVAVWPAKIVGLALDWALSGALSTILLGIVTAPLKALYGGVFLTWAPLIVALTLLGVLLGVARRRGRPASDFGWLVAVIVLTGIIASPVGVSLATSATQATGQAATCAATAPMGGCKDGEGSVSSTVIDGLLSQTWAAAVLGDVADEELPAKVELNEDLKDSTPDIRDDYEVTMPDSKIIPAGPDGVVSYADALRWPNAYTAAEATRMASSPENRCSFRDRLPSIGDITCKTHGDLMPDELCSDKALVRAAIYSDLATHHPGAYASATGKGGAALGAAMAALFGLLPLLIGVACIAVVGLLAELELVLLVLSAPIVGLGALRNPAVGRKWGTELAGTVVKRFAVGVTLGICLWAVGAITATMTKLLSGASAGAGVAGWRSASGAWLPVGVTGLDDLVSVASQERGERGAVGARSLDPEGQDLTDRSRPFQQLLEAAGAGRDLLTRPRRWRTCRLWCTSVDVYCETHLRKWTTMHARG